MSVPCPGDRESGDYPWDYKCVDCHEETDAPTLEVRRVPHLLHTGVEGYSIR